MSARKAKRLIRDGDLVAEVTITLESDDAGWGPTMSKADALRLDDVRDALRRKDYAAAEKLAKLYRLAPVTPDDLTGTDAA